MTDADTAMRVAEALESTSRLRNPRKRAALKLGWTVRALKAWEESNLEMLAIAREAYKVNQQPKAAPPTEDTILEQEVPLTDEGPSEEALAMAVRDSDEKIRMGLKAMKFSDEEAEEAMALEKFNKNHFLTLLDMSCANIMRTDVRMAMEQGKLIKRLEKVREQISNYGEVLCEEREAWVREESLLIKFLLECANVIAGMHDKIIRGQSQLALILQRNRLTPNNSSQGKWKPGFTATVDVK